LCDYRCKGEEIHGAAVSIDAYPVSEKHEWALFSHSLAWLRFPRNTTCTDIMEDSAFERRQLETYEQIYVGGSFSGILIASLDWQCNADLIQCNSRWLTDEPPIRTVTDCPLAQFGTFWPMRANAPLPRSHAISATLEHG
jgi:hypothetical protein